MSETYRELVVQGPYLLIKGFVAGLLAARGLGPEQVLFAHEHHVAAEGLLEQLAEWVRLNPPDSHLLVPHSLYADVHQGLEKAQPLGLAIRSDRPILSASVQFHYTAYTRRHAAELDGVVKRFAPHLRISDDYEPLPEVNSQAEGVEVYTPAHEFTLNAHGTATGALPTVLEFHKEASAHALMKVSAITLHHDGD